MTDTEAPLVALAAGGTGGHIFPAEALARELLGRGLRVALITDQRGSAFGDSLSVPVYRVRAGALGKGLIGSLRGMLNMGIGVWQARGLIKRLNPAAVVGFGGYPSVPTIYAALRVGIPYALHEQNAVLGRANRALSARARLIATCFPSVAGLEAATVAQIVRTGNPVRPAFAALRSTPYAPPGDEGPIRLFVMGGSLGARVFSTVVPQALGRLPAHLRRRLMVAQQCRAEDMDAARTAYAGIGVVAELASFFHDVPERMASAHLALCRAGGSTVAELTAIGRPAIFVPYPHARAGEQAANAAALAEAGGAWVIPEQAFTPESLAARLEALFALPGNLAKTALAARAWGTVTAADTLADSIIHMVEDKPRAVMTDTMGAPLRDADDARAKTQEHAA